MAATSYFFCGIGGSGMMPLAQIVAARGDSVAGSDRALDQGRTAPKFEWLRSLGMNLFPQDGSGIVSSGQIVVASAAVEATVPDIVAATRLGCPRMTRAELLALLFNSSGQRIAIGGTSGKSTVTGMIGWIFHSLGADPTIMNGAVMKNFAGVEAPFASARVGNGEAFITEVDESDGSIALFEPDIAVLNNVAVDHKPLPELRALFGDFVARARVAVLNADHEEVMKLASGHSLTYSIAGRTADLAASDVVLLAEGAEFRVNGHCVRLQLPGRHNVANAMAALGAAVAAGLDLGKAAEALGTFRGLKRRMETVARINGIKVIDDFAHNPDKIAASLSALRAFSGRLILFFQPHGYGPLRLMADELADAFSSKMAAEDRILICDPAYFGGTVDRSVGSDALAARIGPRAEYHALRSDCGDRIAQLAQPGDRIVIMGARDDTLSQFAEDIAARLERTGN